MGTKGSPGCLAAIFGIGREKAPRRERGGIADYRTSEERSLDIYPYRLRYNFMSKAEKSFYRVLRYVVADRALIFTKVGLWDIFFVARPRENFKAKAQIDRKHVDFLLCDPETIRPIVAIELDDSSHQRSDRIERDGFVDAVFKAAELPLLRIPAQYAYNTRDLAAELSLYLGNRQPAPAPEEHSVPPAPEADANSAPLCPKCGTSMVMRVANRGQHQGKRFYACPNYPKCRSVIPVE